MAFCVNCGNQLSENQNFCSKCGTAIGGANPQQQARNSKDGEVIKCPSCGAPANPLNTKCPECGYEFRNRSAAKSVNDFFEHYRNAGPSEKAAIIIAFPIPNTKEDILTFLAMGIGNTKGLTAFEEAEYRNRDGIKSVLIGGSGASALTYQKQEIAAWRAKVQQVLDIGKLLIKDNESRALFQKYEKQLKKELRQKSLAILKICMAFAIGVALIALMMIFLPKPNTTEKETKQLNEIEKEADNGSAR